MLRNMLLSLVALVLCSCGSSSIIKTTKIQSVKTAAIASISLVQPEQKALFNFVRGNSSGNSLATPNMLAMKHKAVEQIYEDLRKSISQKVSWSVIPRNQVVANGLYSNVFTQMMKGVQFGKVPEPGDIFIAEGIMDGQNIHRMNMEKRDKLIAALGVDAIIEARVYIRHEEKSYPRARVYFAAYQKGEANPIWFEGMLDGDRIASGITSDTEYNIGLSVKAAKSAFNNISLKEKN